MAELGSRGGGVAAYGWFLAVAVVLVLAPGLDFCCSAAPKNTLAGGRLGGWSSSVGVTCSTPSKVWPPPPDSAPSVCSRCSKRSGGRHRLPSVPGHRG
jgi:hypothetical protein